MRIEGGEKGTAAYLPHRHEIAGEPFDLEREGESLVLAHPRWSLIGMGPTLLDAERDLLTCAREVAPLYVKQPHASLDEEARKMRDFLLRVV